LSPWDFELFDDNGVQLEAGCEWNVLPDNIQELEFMELYGNPTLIKTLCFTVPAEPTGLLLRYDAPLDWESERWLVVQ